MRIVVAICYLFSLLFYILGYFKVQVLNGGNVTAYNSTIYAAQAVSYFVITIFLAIFGSLLFYLKTTKSKQSQIVTLNGDIKCPNEMDLKRRVG